MSGKAYYDPISSDPVSHIWGDIWTQLSSAALNTFSAVHMTPTSLSRLLSENGDRTRHPEANPMARAYDQRGPALLHCLPIRRTGGVCRDPLSGAWCIES